MNVNEQRDQLIDALDRAMATEDRSTKKVVERSHALMAFELELDPVLSIDAITKVLHSRYKDRGYNHSPGTWRNHFQAGDWLIEQTGGYHWLKGRSYTQHLLASKRDMTIEELAEYPGVLRTNDNGTEGESWQTTLRRIATQAMNEAEIIEVKERQAVRTHKRKHLKVIHSDVVEGAEALLRAVNTMEREAV